MSGQSIYNSTHGYSLWTKDQEAGCTLTIESKDNVHAEIDITAENHVNGTYKHSLTMFVSPVLFCSLLI